MLLVLIPVRGASNAYQSPRRFDCVPTTMGVFTEKLENILELSSNTYTHTMQGLRCFNMPQKTTRNFRTPTVGHVRPAKIQIRLRIRAVWSESSLGAFWKANEIFLHHEDNEDSEQTVRIRRLRRYVFSYFLIVRFTFGQLVFYSTVVLIRSPKIQSMVEQSSASFHHCYTVTYI